VRRGPLRTSGLGSRRSTKRAVEGTFQSGVMELGLKEGGVSVSTLDDLTQFLEATLLIVAGVIGRAKPPKAVGKAFRRE
jgi:basic membrane lipoprotein Med (substrate-binding protein (PBP1-ABC) superfamily)